ncbi:uncharacterized protein LOC144318444 [Canis aureus]
MCPECDALFPRICLSTTLWLATSLVKTSTRYSTKKVETAAKVSVSLEMEFHGRLRITTATRLQKQSVGFSLITLLEYTEYFKELQVVHVSSLTTSSKGVVPCPGPHIHARAPRAPAFLTPTMLCTDTPSMKVAVDNCSAAWV